MTKPFQVHADLLGRVNRLEERQITLSTLAASVRSNCQYEVSLDLEAISGHVDVYDVSNSTDTIFTPTRYIASDEPHSTFQVLRHKVRVLHIELARNDEGMCWVDVVVVDIDQMISGRFWRNRTW